MITSSKLQQTLVAALLLSVSAGRQAECFNPFMKQPKVAVSPLTASLQSASLIKDKWTVLIGVSTFSDPAIPPIKYGAESATKLGRLFLDPATGHFKHDHLVLLQQEDAAKDTVEDVLSNGIASKAMPGDMIILYLSTRWMPSKSGRDIVLCTNDSTLADPDGTGLDLVTTLSTIRKRTQCKNILCLLDLSPVKENSATDKLLTNVPKLKNGPELDIIGRLSALTKVSIISANNLVNSSAQTPFTSTSYFTRFLMEDLQGSGGGMPTDILKNSLINQVHGTVFTEQKVEQIPVVSFTPDFVANLAIGAIVGKSKKPIEIAGIPSNIKFGIPSGRMPIDHPELLPGSGIGIPVAPSPRKPLKIADDSSYSGAKDIKHKAGETSPAGQATAKAQVNSVIPVATTATASATDNDDESDQPKADLDLKPYIATAKRLIQSNWSPPKGLENHKVIAVFTIMRNGSIQQAELTEPSNIAAVDKAALDALKASSPLPPLPAGAPRSIQLRYKFEWKVNRK